MKKIVKTLEGKRPNLRIKKNGQHVGILNTETVIDECVLYETEVRPMVGDTLILPPDIREEMAFYIENNKEAYYGIIYPNETKFLKKLWNTDLISQELANFTTVSKVTHWGKNIYIHLTRDRISDELEILFKTAFNWK